MRIDHVARTVASIVDGLNGSREPAQAIVHASIALAATIEKSAGRTEILLALAAERDRGRLTTEAYTQLIATVARLLAGQATLTDECSRVMDRGPKGG